MKIVYQIQTSKKDRVQAKLRLQREKRPFLNRATGFDQGFICLSCKKMISGSVLISGVRNRNHCPYCLYSRHMDLHQPGDRLAACKAEMRPIGLTLKRTPNRYGEGSEVMLIHQCSRCGKLSINRIAADDLLERILAVFRQMVELGSETRSLLDRADIRLIQSSDLEIVEVGLLGKIKSEPIRY